MYKIDTELQIHQLKYSNQFFIVGIDTVMSKKRKLTCV